MVFRPGLLVKVKCVRDLLVIPRDWKGELDPGLIWSIGCENGVLLHLSNYRKEEEAYMQGILRAKLSTIQRF